LEGLVAIDLRRRELISLLGGMAAAWPLTARAQPPERMRRIGMLFGIANDQETRARTAAFEQNLSQLGWIVGQNIRIDYRYATGEVERMRSLARELIDLRPDVIVAHSTPVTAAVMEATRTLPIVFVVVADPVGSGFVASVPRPGGNVTGFTNLDAMITGKLLTILKEIMPNVTRVALMFNPDTVASGGLYYSRPFEAAAPAFGITPVIAEVREPAAIERIMSSLGEQPGSGMIMMPDNFTTVHRELIIALAARHRLPTIYPYRYFAEAGGLMSYGVDAVDLFRRAPSYVDRILKGEKPSELPVQAPTKFELVINMKTAKALGLTVPRILLAAADTLIE